MDKPNLEINRNQLDREWEEQPKLFLEWAEKLADAQELLEGAKEQLERTKANLDSLIRHRWEDIEKVKFTEAKLSNRILADGEYQDQKNQVLQFQSEVGHLKAIVEALHQRKSALENLVRLHGQEYFSAPTVSDEERAAYRQKRVQEVTRTKLNKPKTVEYTEQPTPTRKKG